MISTVMTMILTRLIVGSSRDRKPKLGRNSIVVRTLLSIFEWASTMNFLSGGLSGTFQNTPI